jgi:hypothetical protein
MVKTQPTGRSIDEIADLKPSRHQNIQIPKEKRPKSQNSDINKTNIT